MTWETLNQDVKARAMCAKCNKPRTSTPHQKKLFLVAERLSWETGVTPLSARSQNDIALWAVNAELDIYDPAVEDEDTVLGGKHSRDEPAYPFKSDEEAEFAMRIIAKAETLTRNSWEVWKAQADAALNVPPAKASTGPGSAAEPLDLTSDGPKTAVGKDSGQPPQNKQQDAVYKLLREWSKTDSILKTVLDALEKKVPLSPHGVQIFNLKVEAATKAVRGMSSTVAEPDVTTAAKGESPAVLEILAAKARDDPDFRALTMSVSKGVATAQMRALFQTHVLAARAATSEIRQPLQRISPNSTTQNVKGKAADREVPRKAPKKLCSYQTLKDFYGLLDKIERTSPMGAKYLEAYAERLQAESCKDCWFSKNVLPGLTEDEPEHLVKAAPTAPAVQHRASLTTARSAPSHAHGYVDRYRAQHGQNPPPHTMRHSAAEMPPRPPVAATERLLTTTGISREHSMGVPGPQWVPAHQQHVQLPTGIVFPTPEQLGLPPASQVPGKAQGTSSLRYVSPYATAPSRKDRR